MLAAKMYGIDDIRLEEVAIPEISEDEVLLKIKAAALCGTDIRMIKNGYPGISEDSPRVLGHEFSGVIERIGNHVEGYKIGQRVAVAPNMGCGICAACISGNSHLCADYKAIGIHFNGAFAEYVVIPARAVRSGCIFPIADNVSFEEAAINEALSCVCNGFERCDIHPGDNVVVIGAGPIGIMHAMLAKMAGAGRVYISDLSESRLEICKQIDPSFITVKDNLAEVISKDTNGFGADVCITACPAPAAQQTALEICGFNARINFFGGIPADKQPISINTNLIHYKQLIVSGTCRASLTQYGKVLNFITTGILDVKPLIARTIPLKNIQEGIDFAAAADGLKNVIVMD